MFPALTDTDLRMMMGFTFFAIGLLSVGAGIVKLMLGPFRAEAKLIAAQSARISQKALTDDIAAVAQSAASLVHSVNELIRTSSGNAVVLIIVGTLFQFAAYKLLIAW
ncbi:MAG: hypothetical protein JNL09_05475 [Anaerolineales bacterium]|nr:hypothetical protein [Anaerolineales bacterium]